MTMFQLHFWPLRAIHSYRFAVSLLLVVSSPAISSAQSPAGYPPVLDFKTGTLLSLNSADGIRVAQAESAVESPPTVVDEPVPTTEPTPAPPELLPTQPATDNGSATIPAPQMPISTPPGQTQQNAPATTPSPTDPTNAVPPYDVLQPVAIESPVARMFRDLSQQLGDSQKREAEQFESMLRRIDRIHDNLARQQRTIALQRELQQARDAALAQMLNANQQSGSAEPSPAAEKPTAEQQATDHTPDEPATVPSEPVMPPEPTIVTTPAPQSDEHQNSDEGASSSQVANDDPSDTSSPDETSTATDDEGLPDNPLELTSTVDRAALADNLFAAGRYEVAGPIYEGLLQHSLPQQDELWYRYQLATCYRAVGDIPNARKHFLVIAGTKGATEFSKMATWWLDHLNEKERLRERLRGLRNGFSELRSGENK